MTFEQYLVGKKFGNSGIEVIAFGVDDTGCRKYNVQTKMSSAHWYSKPHFIQTIISAGLTKEIKELYPEEFI